MVLFERFILITNLRDNIGYMYNPESCKFEATTKDDLLHNIITPKKHVYKKYYVKTELPFDISNIDKTYEILDGRDRPYIPLKAIAETISSNEFYLSIMEGKFHQVKRMVQHFDNEVIYLKRVSIGKIILDESLQTGEYKEIEDYSI